MDQSIGFKNDHPGVYVPPPIIYVAFFLLSVLLQKLFPLNSSLLHTKTAFTIGWVFIALYLLFFLASVGKFIISRNTLITVKPATSLQTSGIYSISRNPMYICLLFLYCGIAVFKGSWWTFIVLPGIILVIQEYVIKKEESYLLRAFGKEYFDYKRKVRRWL